jgi:dienelactone hydrolase
MGIAATLQERKGRSMAALRPPFRLSAQSDTLRLRVHDGLQPVRAAAQTAVFFLKVLPMLPSKPIDWATTAPVVERVRYRTPGGEAEGDLYRPSSPGPRPGMVVCLGVVPFGDDHPQVPRLGAALARAGFAALLYWSPAMRDLRLDPEDVEGIALAYQWLIEQPGIDAGRSGLLGTCVGGSFALMAAADPSIRDRVAFVAAWAPYSSMRTLARDIATATASSDATPTRWQVDQLTRKVYVRSMTSVLEPHEADRLRNACAERNGRVDAGELSADGRAVCPLLLALDADAAETALDRLPAAVQQRLDAMSPMNYLADIRASLIVLAHDRDDRVIPIGESRRLRDALDGRAGVRYTEFTMFKHLDPTKVRLPLRALAREMFKFYRSVYPLFRQAVVPSGVLLPRPHGSLATSGVRGGPRLPGR